MRKCDLPRHFVQRTVRFPRRNKRCETASNASTVLIMIIACRCGIGVSLLYAAPVTSRSNRSLLRKLDCRTYETQATTTTVSQHCFKSKEEKMLRSRFVATYSSKPAWKNDLEGLPVTDAYPLSVALPVHKWKGFKRGNSASTGLRGPLVSSTSQAPKNGR